MYNFKKSVAAVAVAASLGFSVSAVAANNAGIVKGVVLDSNNQAVAGATITIKNTKTGFTRSVTADENGAYRFPSMPVGSYVITTSKAGFEGETVEGVGVRIGETSVTIPMVREGVERIEVTGRSVAMIDTTSSESALNIGAVELSRLPVARDVTSVALLAPGTTKGDGRFGNFASFGGSSVAENAYFVNGLNVTNFRNGLGGSTIPFEFYKEFQVKTGGYSAEFGRSTGGVINAVTKSGSNEWEFAANLYYSPDSLRSDSPNILRRNGDMDVFNGADYTQRFDANISVAGPIIEDTLFFYVLYNPRDLEDEWASSAGQTFNNRKQDDAFWGGKIDWNISEDHVVEVTAFSDKRDITDTTYDYDYKTGVKGDPVLGTSSRGGKNISVKYTGYITDDLTISALWGENEADQTDVSEFDSNPVVYDRRSGSWVRRGQWANFNVQRAKDTREAFRIDGEYAGFEDHVLRFGWDSEKNNSFDETGLSGGIYYAYFAYEPGDTISSINHTFTESAEVVRTRDYARGGEYDTLSNALYIEDTWTINDEFTATIGIRSESFENKNAEGNAFIKIDNQIAPRLGLSWDIGGEGESKLFFNAGRYHLPVAANTNIRMAGAETYIHNYYILEGVNADDTPIFNTSTLLGTQVNSDGSVPDAREVLDTSIKPMYQDELIVGYQSMLAEDWTWGVKATWRDLGSVIDDITIDKAIRKNGWAAPSGNVYVLTNPNTNIETYYDTDGDGTLDPVSIDAADLGYPDPTRKYYSIDFNVARQWDDVWSLDATYTWSHSYGNAEGYVKSDNAQTDAGLTTDWDFPYLMDGAYGNLPNDRRHTFKAYGAYALTENLQLGFNMLLQSGRPINGFGHGLPEGYGDGFDQYEYGQTYFVGDGSANFAPRGSYGRTPWTFNLDLSAKYTTEISGADVTFQVDVFNVLDADGVVRVDENENDGTTNDDFLLPTAFQTPRRVQFSASVRF